MQKYTFESWLLGAAFILAGLILLPSSAHALDPSSIDIVAQHPIKFSLGMFMCYLGIKMVPSSREHF